MATFSVNNVRHLIVANALNDAAVFPANSVGGTLGKPKAIEDQMYFPFSSNSDVITKSDYIKKTNVVSATYKNADASARTLGKFDITIDQQTLTAMVGQDLMIRLLFREWGSGSPEDQYIKVLGAVRVKSTSTPTSIMAEFKALGDVLFSRDTEAPVSFSASAGKLTITENVREWVLGKKQERVLNFVVQLVPVDGAADWATIAETPGKLQFGSGKTSADLEYFYIGERGDTYRQTGYPYTFDTKYLVNIAKTYDTLDIVYYQTEDASGEKAKKQLTILIDSSLANGTSGGSGTGASYGKNGLCKAINEILGTSLKVDRA